MKNHVAQVIAVLASAITCGATFLFALYRQLALVEVTASMTTMAEVYFLSSSIGDLIEKRNEPNRMRLFVAIGLALGVLGYFLIARTLHW